MPWQIAVMKKELSELQPQLIEAAKATDAVMSIIEKETAQVAKKQELVKEDEAKANVQAEEASKLKAECLEDLAEALPLLDSKFDKLQVKGKVIKRFSFRVFDSINLVKV